MKTYFIISLEKDKRHYSINAFDDESELISFFSEKKQIVLYFIKLPINYSIQRIKLKPDETIELIESLYLILKSGLPIHTGLIELAADSDNKKFKKVLLHIAELLSKGHSLSYAFNQFPRIFNSMVLTLVKVGEDSGQLEYTLETASNYLKKNLSLKKKVKQALMYPSFAFVGVFIAMIVWMLYVLPAMSSLFKEMHVALPPLTVFFIEASSFMLNYIYLIVGSLIFFIFGFISLYKKNYKFNFFINKFLLKIPVVKQVILGFNTSLIMEYLRISLNSGIPLFVSLNSLVENTSNVVFKKAVLAVKEDVLSGRSLSYSFRQTGIFNSFVLRMLSTGEESGNLDRQMSFISDYYNQKVYYYAENIGKIIEPLIIIFVGAFMALVMMALMTPIYDLISNLS